MQRPDSTNRAPDTSRLWLLLYAAVAVFAGGFCWVVGHRGVFLLDQSILFDGAWRVVQGQTQYRDFFSAFPPMAFWIQALFFRLCGVTFSSTVLSAAFLNVVATICVMFLIARLLPGQKICAAMGGLLTAVWFQAPYGTLWFEQTAFAFNLVGLTLIVYAGLRQDSTSVWLRFAAGVFLVAAALGKQNAGLEFIPFAFGLAALPSIRQPAKALRLAGPIAAGFLAAASVFAFWLWMNSSFGAFWHDYFAMAAQIENERTTSVFRLAQSFLVRMITPRYMLALVALALVWFSKKPDSGIPNQNLIQWIALGMILFQDLFLLHSFNEEENSLPYLGVIYGLALALFVERSRRWIERRIKDADRPLAWSVVALLSVLAFGVMFADGLATSWYRTVQQFDAQTSFGEPLKSPGLSGVWWGKPTPIARPEWRKVDLSRNDFEGLNAWLTATDANFFVFKDATMLYGLHQRISPQPWLYFSPGHGFRKDELARVDAEVVASLRRNHVEVIIVENETWVDVGLLEKMPKLAAFIADDFKKVREFGAFDAYQIRPSDVTAGISH
ncbi:MAG TPA: glycosyltransferase family 39 protein [Terriglobia bacterium]|nr:glycosyltransferase family 39 protein [Terriglobia bacterium]